MSAMHCRGTLIAVLQIGLISLLSSAFLVCFRRARLFSILAVEAARRLRFTWWRGAFASPAWTVRQRSSRYAEPGCRIRNGSSAICDPWPLGGDLAGYWPGIAS